MTDMTGGLTSRTIAQGIRDDREKATRARWAASEPAKWNEPRESRPRSVPFRPGSAKSLEPVRPDTRAQIYEAKKFIETLQHENLGQLPPNLFNALRALHDAIEMVADDLGPRSSGRSQGGDTVGSSWSNRQRVG